MGRRGSPHLIATGTPRRKPERSPRAVTWRMLLEPWSTCDEPAVSSSPSGSRGSHRPASRSGATAAWARPAAAGPTHALAFWRGLRAAGVLGCGKHFPGHGDTATDSHHELPRVEHDGARLRSVELAPFAAAAHAGMEA